MILPIKIAETGIILKDNYFDLQGLSAYSTICVSTLRDHIRRDGLPAFKVRGKILIRRSEFDSWMEHFRENKKKDIEAIADEVIGQLVRRS